MHIWVIQFLTGLRLFFLSPPLTFCFKYISIYTHIFTHLQINLFTFSWMLSLSHLGNEIFWFSYSCLNINVHTFKKFTTHRCSDTFVNMRLKINIYRHNKQMHTLKQMHIQTLNSFLKIVNNLLSYILLLFNAHTRTHTHRGIHKNSCIWVNIIFFSQNFVHLCKWYLYNDQYI